jgi:hypothetical protein
MSKFNYLGVEKMNKMKYLIGILLIMAFVVPVAPQAIAGDVSASRAPSWKYVVITSPADGAVVSGSVTITVDAGKTPAIFVDGVQVAEGYSFTWDSTAVADGVHTIYAEMRGETDTITVTTDNGAAPVNEAPIVTINSPTAGDTVSGTTTISVDVTDDSDSLVPDIYIDGAYVTTASTYDWDTTAYADGTHTIMAEATDSGSLSDSDTLDVTVDNPDDPPAGDGDDYFYGLVEYGAPSWNYIDAGLGLINVELTWDTSYDVDMYLYRPSDYSNYVVRAYTTNKPETMSFDADEAGMWALEVRMYSSSGYNTNYELHVTYTPNTPDTTAPVCDITAPSNGAVVYKTTYIQVTATDDRTVDYVDFFVDGALVGTDVSAPFSYAWDTTAYGDGAYVIDATAYDQAGNFDAAAQVSVTVDQSAAPATDVQKYAVIVGISDYAAISDLSYCDEDASDWYNFLVGTINVPADHITVLGDGHTNDYPAYDGEATEANIKAALANMVAIADDDDEIYFLTSGHGSGDGRGNSYICAYDCGAGVSGEDGDFWDYEVADCFAGAIADKIFIFIDHCYSGGIGPELMALSNAAHILVATTCTDDGYGWDSPDHNNGLWTAYFLEISWIDHFGSDPSVSLEDVFAYAHANYPKTGGDEPQLFDGAVGTPMVI